MIEFFLPAMSCGHCVKAVTATVLRLDPLARLEFDLPRHAVRVEPGSANPVDLQAWAAALTAEGFPPAMR
ncbi:MAG: copper chaperone [Ideonella sp. MAG2]|nr:MAG: copper chaperone [Ideonella sp. MAG2]